MITRMARIVTREKLRYFYGNNSITNVLTQQITLENTFFPFTPRTQCYGKIHRVIETNNKNDDNYGPRRNGVVY